jgi:hypothetical protein
LNGDNQVMMKQRVIVWSLWILLLSSVPASAEVMDKELSVSSIWLYSFVSAIAGFIICRFRPSLGIISISIAGIFICGVISEVLDPVVGLYIQREFGSSYIFHICAASCFVVASHILGMILNRRQLKRS